MSSTGKTVRLTVAQALVKYLQLQYSELDGKKQRLIRGMFGIFGHGNVAGMGQALEEYGAGLPYYQPHNEQSMVHSAVGYTKAMRRLSTMACAASIGPGSTNMLTGAACATINRLPVLLLPADYYATRFQGPVLQQLEHPISADISVNDAFRPLSRFFDRITRPEQLLTALPEAMRVLTEPAETGAVTIALPQDIQSHAYAYPAEFFEERSWRIERRLPDPMRIREAVELLKKAKRPFIVAGGGVLYSFASDALKRFAESFGIPVGETFAGKGALIDSPMLAGGFGITGSPVPTRFAAEADVVVCIGTRLTDFSTGARSVFQDPDVRFISINVTGHDAFKMGSLPIVADARETLKKLHAALNSAGVKPRQDRVRALATSLNDWESVLHTKVYIDRKGEAMSQGRLLGIMNEESKPGDVVIGAAGSPPGDVLKIWDTSGGREAHLEFGFSCMGYEIPAGIGVRMAKEKGEVFVFIGDGTYLMQPTELVTAAKEGLKITLVLSENHGFQCIKGLQKHTAGPEFGNEFRHRQKKSNRLDGEYVKVDFGGNAEAFGARVWRVATPDELRHAFREARKEKRPCAIVVEIEPDRMLPDSGVWFDVAPAEVSGNARTRSLRAAYEKRQKKQRFYY